jgi:glycosyltransferase involved in cell wall biosynthesis
MRVGFFKKADSFVSRKVIEGNFLKFLGEYVETVPIPAPGAIDAPLSHPADADRLADRLAVLPTLEGLRLDYIYSGLGSLTPFLFIARELHGIDVSFVVPAFSVSPDLWLVHWLILAPLIRPGDVVMIPNETIRQALGRISPVYERQDTLIPWPIDLERVSQVLGEHTPATLNRTIIYVGRMIEGKNVHLLIEAMPDVLKVVPTARLQLFVPRMTGGGLNVALHYYQRLRKRCKSLSLNGQVDFVGPVGEKAKYCSMADSAALVSPSLFSGETFGYAILEALACGTPVVCTAWNGHRDLVTDQYNGFLVPTFWDQESPCLDEKALRQALIRVLTNDAEERARLGARARESVTRYDYRHVIPRLVSLMASSATTERRNPDLSFDTLLDRPIGATDGIWTDSLLRQFGELASLGYGAIVGMRYGQGEEAKMVTFLETIKRKLGPYLTAGYVSSGGQAVDSRGGAS